jgi:hypothetical protein
MRKSRGKKRGQIWVMRVMKKKKMRKRWGNQKMGVEGEEEE